MATIPHSSAQMTQQAPTVDGGAGALGGGKRTVIRLGTPYVAPTAPKVDPEIPAALLSPC